jgi:putative ABC transport system substrate-binding protein
MKRKIILLALCSLLLAPCSAVDAQQTGKVFHIGFLDNSTASGNAVRLEEFRQEPSKLGWIEGKNIAIEYRFAEQKRERLPELAADLVRLKVDLIVASGGPTPLAAKGATSTIPIVMTTSPDPVGEGLVASLARPGGNVTGLSGLAPRAKHQKAGGTQRRGSQARPSWASAESESRHNIRQPNERAQGCGSSTEAKIGGDRD